MTQEQEALLKMAQESLAAARLLADGKIYRFAVSRAYYSMFYCAQALLLAKGLSFSKHSAVIAAFGKDLAKAGAVPVEFHRYLIDAAEIREEGDYDSAATVDKHDCDLHLQRADAFVQGTEKILRG